MIIDDKTRDDLILIACQGITGLVPSTECLHAVLRTLAGETYCESVDPMTGRGKLDTKSWIRSRMKAMSKELTARTAIIRRIHDAVNGRGSNRPAMDEDDIDGD